MVAKSAYSIAFGCLLLALIAPGSAQQSRHNMDAVSPDATAKQRQGLVDYTLDQIAKEGRDYGQCLDEGRKLLIEETFDRAYFWSDLLATGVSVCLFLVVVHQHRLLQRRELIAAESLTQYHNALTRAQAQAEEATRRNHELMEALSASSRLTSVAESVAPKLKKDTVLQVRSSVATVPVPTPAAVKSNSPKPALASPAPARAVSSVAATAVVESPENRTKPSNQMGLFSPDVDLIAKINSLQQQLSTAQEREKQLRRQLNDSDLRLQKEQQKNRSLQG